MAEAPSKSYEEHSVTVVVPNYNYARYIRSTMESIAAQSLSPLQTIVYDDGSTDDSIAVIERAFRELEGRLGKAQLIAEKANKGKLHGLNVAIPRAIGTYTAILDADDQLRPNFLEVLVSRLHAARAADALVGFAYSDCDLIDEAGKYIAPGNSESFNPDRLQEASYIPDCAPTLTSELVAALPFDESIRVATKHHKWLRIVARGVRGCHVPERLFSYRMHDANMSGIGGRIRADVTSGGGRERILSKYWQSVSARNIE